MYSCKNITYHVGDILNIDGLCFAGQASPLMLMYTNTDCSGTPVISSNDNNCNAWMGNGITKGV